MSAHTQYLLAFLLYFASLLTLGFIFYQKQKTDADFIVGDRSLNFWLTALSAHASDMSAWLFMAFPAAVFVGGVPQIWIAIGLILGMYLNWQFVATRLRTYTERYKSYTLSTFFENRFADTSGIIRVVTGAMQVIFLTCYLAALLIAMGGVLLESIFGLNYFFGVSVAFLVVVIFTYYGGYITIAWTDLFQAIFLLFCILFVPIYTFLMMDEPLREITAAAAKQQISLTLLDDLTFGSIFTSIMLILGWGLGYFGQPHILTKFMGIKKPSEIPKSKYLGMSWQIVALAAAFAVGFVGIGFFADKGLQNPELVYVEMVKSLFQPFTAGIIICGILAANISSMASQLLVSASVLSEDFYKHLVKKDASKQELLFVTRMSVIIVAVIAILISFNRSTTVLEAVLYAWSGLGCSFGPLIIMSLYSKSANRYGAIAGIIVGGAIAGFWPILNPYITNLIIPSMVPGFFLSLLSIYVVSLIFHSWAHPLKKQH